MAKLSFEELNKRCHEVFLEPDDIETTYVEVGWDGGTVCVDVVETERYKNGKVKNVLNFTYEPDMTERPHALDYILGLRDDFDD